MSDKTGTRHLILEAVVACIEKYGIDKVTTRKIALEAGTNIASINYYFHSKDELLAEALSMTINHMLEDVFIAIDDLHLPFERMLANVFFYLLDGSLKFPGVSRAHLYKSVVERDRDSVSVRAMVKLFDRLSQRAAHEYPARAPQEIRLAVSQVLSSILFSMLAPDFFPLSREYRPTSPKNVRGLADSYAKRLSALL